MNPWLPLRRLTTRGRGVTLALRGPAGVGKSHLARQVLQSLPCRQLHLLADAPPHLLMRSVPASPREPEWVNHVSRRLDNQESVPPQQAAAALHARLNLHLPVVLVADHLHRCTPAQLEFWQALGHLVRGSKGLGLLALTRQQAPAGWAEFTVEPLYRAESDALVAGSLGSAAPGPLLDWLYDKARGHPLYTLELLRHEQRQGNVQVMDGQVRWRRAGRDSLPSTLEGLVRSQVPAGLSVGAWRALARLLLSAPLDSVPPDALQELEALDLCRAGALAHPLYRDALLPLVPADVLGQVLSELTDAPGTEPLADPLRIAQITETSSLPVTVRERLQMAAAQHAQAKEDWETAAQLWEGLADHWAAARCWTNTTQDRQRAGPHLHSLLQTTPGLTGAQWQELAALLSRAGEALEPWQAQVPPEWLDQVQETYRWTQFEVCSGEDVLRLWNALPAEWQARASARVLNAVGYAHFTRMRDLNMAQSLLERAREQGEADTRALALNNLGLLPLYRGDAEAALPYFEELLTQLPSVPSVRKRERLEENALYNIAMCLSHLNRPHEALRMSQQLADKAYARGDMPDYVDHLMRVGQHLTSLARFQEASDVLSKCHDYLRYLPGESQRRIFSYLIPLHFDWMADQSPALMAHFVAELEGLLLAHPDWGWLQDYFMLAQGLVFCGQPDAAEHYLERGLTAAREKGVTQGLRYGQWLRSVIQAERGDWTGAAQTLTAADGSAERDTQFELWRAYYLNDEAALETLYAEVSAENDLAQVHAVRVRQQERQAAFTDVAQSAQPFIQLLGEPQVFDASGQPFKSRSGLRLLTLLLCARLTGEDGLNTLDVAVTLFPERDEENAVRAVRRLVGRVREALGEAAVQQSGDKLLLGEVQSDAELFLQTQEGALWRGVFLGGEGPDEFTEAARALLLTRLEGLTESLLDTDPAEAERLSALLCRAEPYESRLLALQLRAHDAASHPRQAGAAYRHALKHFAEVGEELPDRWQDFLARQQASAPALVALAGGPASGTVSAARQARALQVHRSTILRWQKGEVQRPGQRGRAPQLTDEALAQVRDTIARPRQDGRAWSLAVIAEHVHEQHGVKLSRSQLSRLLRQ